MLEQNLSFKSKYHDKRRTRLGKSQSRFPLYKFRENMKVIRLHFKHTQLTMFIKNVTKRNASYLVLLAGQFFFSNDH